MNVPIELYQLILIKSDFLAQIRLRCANKLFYHRLEICDFYSIEWQYIKLLTDDILKNYSSITKLSARSNSEITNVNHLTRLEILDAGCPNNGITDAGIVSITNLKELYAYGNPGITNINHLTRLEILIA